MAVETLEKRVEKLEVQMREMETRLAAQSGKTASKKRGWRWFVGIDANNLHFEEAARLGQEWRYADRPKDDEEEQT